MPDDQIRCDRQGVDVMETIGPFEAKTHLSQLLERVAKGEEFLIIDRGMPVARLVPPRVAKPESDVRATVEAMKQFRRGRTLGGKSTIRDLIKEGRRS